MSGGYLTVAAVAEEAGFSPRTVLRWVEAGDLEAVRFPGGRLRIPQTAWMAFLAERSTDDRPAVRSLPSTGRRERWRRRSVRTLKCARLVSHDYEITGL